MKFNYTPLRDLTTPRGVSRKIVRMPLLGVRLSYEDKHTDIVGLIDTGAIDCLFDQDVAEDLGIDIRNSPTQRDYFGLDGVSLIGYIHKVGFRLQKFSEWIEIEVGFLECKLPFQLLGQSGFFDNYEVNMKRFRGKFEIKSRTFLNR
jgi:hypothetical protein